jgi:hypothetical protein
VVGTGRKNSISAGAILSSVREPSPPNKTRQNFCLFQPIFFSLTSSTSDTFKQLVGIFVETLLIVVHPLLLRSELRRGQALSERMEVVVAERELLQKTSYLSGSV